MPWIIWKQGIFLTGFRLNGHSFNSRAVTGMTGGSQQLFQEGPVLLYFSESRKRSFPILGATPGIISSIQVSEAVKFLTGKENSGGQTFILERFREFQ